MKGKGKLIVVCGMDGTGKSTVVKYLNSQLKNMEINSVYCEPLKFESKAMINKLFDLKFNSGEIENIQVEQLIGDYIFGNFLRNYTYKILPLIENGINVISDRFIYSHIVNQQAFGVDTKNYELFLNILKPDIILYLKADKIKIIERIFLRNKEDWLLKKPIILDKIFENFDFYMKNFNTIDIDTNGDFNSIKNNLNKVLIQNFKKNE